MTRIAATCVLLAASLTAVVRHHDRPESSSATLVDRPLPTRASRGLQRHPLSGRVNTALASVKARRRLTHGPRHVATSHETGSHPVVLRDQTADVTMYCATGNRNAAGRWPRLGDVAVLDRSIPFGSRVRIDGNVYTVEDWIGSGSDFDIFGGNDAGCESRALAFGRRHEPVVVER